MRKWDSLGVRLIGALCVANIIPIFFIFLFTTLLLRENVTTMIRKESEDEKQRITTILNNRAYELERLGTSFARSSELFTALEARRYEEVETYSNRILDVLSEVDGAVIYDAQKTIVASSFRTETDLEQLINPVLLNRTVGSSLYGQEMNFHYIIATDRDLYFVSIVQIQNGDPNEKKATGALVLLESLDLAFLQTLYNNFRYNVIHVDPIAQEIEGTWQAKQFIEKNGITFEQLMAEKPLIFDDQATILVPVYKNVWAQLSMGSIIATMGQIVDVVEQVMMISLLLSIIVSVVLRFGIIQPLTRLVKELEYMRKMKRLTKLPEKGPKEIVAVASAFNNVLNNLDVYRDQAQRDGLTNSFNHRSLQHYLGELESTKSEVTIFFGDIDYFKMINDTYGHDQGDQVICDVVNVFERVLGESATVFRYGGEEFVGIMPILSKTKAYVLGEQIRYHVMGLEYPEVIGQITISIGISDTTQSMNFQEVMQQADAAMYKAKQNGRNQVQVNWEYSVDPREG